jgi:FkbM family methyltransferase
MPLAAEKLIRFARCGAALGPTSAARIRLFWRLLRNVRVSVGLGSYAPESVAPVQTTFGTLYFRDNVGDITNLVKIIYGCEYRHRSFPEPGVIIDVGANIGMAAVWFRQFNPGRQIFCFEPLPENTHLLRMNCPEAEIISAAAGATPGEVRLNVDDSGMMASSIPSRWESRVRSFTVTPLDAFARERQIGSVSVLKIDAEGMELDVLAGAAELLLRTCRVILETHGRERHAAVLDRLRRAGFVIDSDDFATDTGLVFASRPVSGTPAPIHESLVSLA